MTLVKTSLISPSNINFTISTHASYTHWRILSLCLSPGNMPNYTETNCPKSKEVIRELPWQVVQIVPCTRIPDPVEWVTMQALLCLPSNAQMGRISLTYAKRPY